MIKRDYKIASIVSLTHLQGIPNATTTNAYEVLRTESTVAKYSEELICLLNRMYILKKQFTTTIKEKKLLYVYCDFGALNFFVDLKFQF